jgi:hypothetical protein
MSKQESGTDDILVARRATSGQKNESQRLSGEAPKYIFVVQKHFFKKRIYICSDINQ